MNGSNYYTFFAATGKPANEADTHATETTGHAANGDAHGEEASALSAFGLDPLAFLLQLGAIIVFYVLFRKLALKKVVSVLDERHNTIEKSLSDAQQIAKDVAAAEEKQAELLAEARTQAEVIMSDANNEAGLIIKNAEDRATSKVEGMIKDAHSRIEDDIAKAKRNLQTEVASLVAEATESIIGEKLDAKKDQDLIKKALSGVK